MAKIVLIGAGSAIFGLGTISDIFNSNVLKGSTITLHDINKGALEKTKDIAEKYNSKFSHNFRIEATTDRKVALKGADFCLISIEVGHRFDLWDQDWKIPLQYGFRQIYGENGGPGGLFHSLRIIPPILEICEDIKKICPNSFVFNYSNPMQRISHAVTTKFPELKAVIVDLLTHEFDSFLASIDWVAPRPTTFRINLRNDENFYLIWMQRSWVAQVEGKKYYLLNLPEEENCVQHIARILRYGAPGDGAEAGENEEVDVDVEDNVDVDIDDTTDVEV